MDKNQPTPSETPDEYKGLHRALLYVAGFFFLYLIVESAVLIPALFMRYGFH